MLWPLNPAVIRLGIHQNNVGANALDTAPGDNEVVPVPGQPHKAAGAGHNNGAYLSFRKLYQNIGDESQPLSIADTDDLPALKVCKFTAHTHILHP